MPAKMTKSVLGSSVDPHIKVHANDETTYGLVKLPGGIVNGVARLQECYFATHEDGENKGKPYFRAVGVVVAPDSVGVNGSMVPVKGLQTSIVLPWYARGDVDLETAKAKVMNELRKLAGPEATNACSTGEELEALAAAITETGPFFRFSTSESTPQIDPTTGKPKLNPKTGKPYDPRVWENWNGTKGLENYGEEHVPTTDVKDSSKTISKTEASSNGVAEYRDDEDLDSLAKRAKDDEEVAERLKKMAIDSGYTEEEVDDSTSWAEVVSWIKSGGKKDDPNQGKTPKIDDVVKYLPPDPKNSKKRLKAIDCQVIKVDRKEKTVELSRLDDRRKKFNDISWDDLDYE